MSDAFEQADPSGAARAAVFARTLSVQRRRRVVRRVAAAAIVVGAYAAGLVTPRPAVTAPASEPPPRAEIQAPTRAAPDTGDPRELERRASVAATKNERVDLLRAAGDHYLGDRGDIEAALRCYRQLIDAAPNDLQSDSADSWLLSALKRGGD